MPLPITKPVTLTWYVSSPGSKPCKHKDLRFKPISPPNNLISSGNKTMRINEFVIEEGLS